MKIKSKNVWVNEELKPKVVEFKDGKITQILDYDSEADIDYGSELILPGFIDIHTHGYAGVNANRADEKGLEMWANNYPNEGVTSFLATTGTQDYDNNLKALKTIANYIKNQDSGAEILGINVEGNFISKKYKGAQDENYITGPDVEVVKDYIVAANNNIMSVACAVEDDQDLEFVKYLVGRDIAVSAAHTNATYEETVAAIDVGLSGATHTGNAMRPFHHRQPGVFGAAMNRPELYAEVICDGLHLHFETINIIGTLKGKDKLILVTDSSSYKDYTEVEEGYERVIGEDGSIRNAAGNLSGSALKFNKGLYNAHYKARLPLETVINAATINPAKYLKVDDRKGSIEVSKDADFSVVNKDFDVLATFVKGVQVVK